MKVEALEADPVEQSVRMRRSEHCGQMKRLKCRCIKEYASGSGQMCSFELIPLPYVTLQM